MMGLFWRFKLPGHFRVTFTVAKTIDVYGVNSELTDGDHMLMWDFDGYPLETVTRILARQQEDYDLPKVSIFQTRADGQGYHAYCFQRFKFPQAVAMIAETPCVDWDFIKWAVVRGKFTLRLSSKSGYLPHHVVTLASRASEDCSPEDMNSYVRYETLERTWGMHDTSG